MRKGWVSCKKAGQAFIDNNSELEIEIDAKKETIKGDAGWDLVKESDTIFITSGKKILEFTPSEENREIIMKKMLGRTGNLRAPAIRKDNSFYIGFNEELYTTVLFSWCWPRFIPLP